MHGTYKYNSLKYFLEVGSPSDISKNKYFKKKSNGPPKESNTSQILESSVAEGNNPDIRVKVRSLLRLCFEFDKPIHEHLFYFPIFRKQSPTTEFNSDEERLISVQGFLKDFFGDSFNNDKHIHFDKILLNCHNSVLLGLELAKLALVLISIGVVSEASHHFTSAAIQLPEEMHFDVVAMLRSAILPGSTTVMLSPEIERSLLEPTVDLNESLTGNTDVRQVLPGNIQMSVFSTPSRTPSCDSQCHLTPGDLFDENTPRRESQLMPCKLHALLSPFLETAVTPTSKDVLNLKESRDKLRQELTTLRLQLNNEIFLKEELQFTLQDYKSDILKKDAEIFKLRERVKGLLHCQDVTDELQDLKLKYSEVDENVAKLKKMVSSLVQYKDLCQVQEKELITLYNKLALNQHEIKMLQAEVDNSRKSQDCIKRLEEQVVALKEENVQFSLYKLEYEHLKQELHVTREENDKLFYEIEVMSSGREEWTSRSLSLSECSMGETMDICLDIQLRELKGQLEEVIQERGGLDIQLRELKGQLEEVIQKRDGLDIQLRELKGQLEEVIQERDGLLKQLHILIHPPALEIVQSKIGSEMQTDASQEGDFVQIKDKCTTHLSLALEQLEMTDLDNSKIDLIEDSAQSCLLRVGPYLDNPTPSVSNSEVVSGAVVVGDAEVVSDAVVVEYIEVVADTEVVSDTMVVGNTEGVSDAEVVNDTEVVSDAVVVGDTEVVRDAVVVEYIEVVTDTEVVGDTEVVSDCVVVGDAEVVSDCVVVGDDEVVSDCVVVGDAEFVYDCVVVGDDEVVSDCVVVGDAEVVSDCVFVGDAEVVSDCVVVGDAEVVSDCEVVGDTEVVSDCVVVGDAEVVSDCEVVGDTEVVSDCVVVGDAEVVSDCVVVGDAEVVSDCVVVGDAEVVSDCVVVGDAEVVSDCVVVGDAEVVSDCVVVGDDEVVKDTEVVKNIEVGSDAVVVENIEVVSDALVVENTEVGSDALVVENIEAVSDAVVVENIEAVSDAVVVENIEAVSDAVVVENIEAVSDAVVVENIEVVGDNLVCGQCLETRANLKTSEELAYDGNTCSVKSLDSSVDVNTNTWHQVSNKNERINVELIDQMKLLKVELSAARDKLSTLDQELHNLKKGTEKGSKICEELTDQLTKKNCELLEVQNERDEFSYQLSLRCELISQLTEELNLIKEELKNMATLHAESGSLIGTLTRCFKQNGEWLSKLNDHLNARDSKCQAICDKVSSLATQIADALTTSKPKTMDHLLTSLNDAVEQITVQHPQHGTTLSVMNVEDMKEVIQDPRDMPSCQSSKDEITCSLLGNGHFPLVTNSQEFADIKDIPQCLVHRVFENRPEPENPMLDTGMDTDSFRFNGQSPRLDRHLKASREEMMNKGNTTVVKVLSLFDKTVISCTGQLDSSRAGVEQIKEAKDLYAVGHLYRGKARLLSLHANINDESVKEASRKCLQTAVHLYSRSLALVQTLGDRTAEGKLCGQLGNSHYTMGNFVKAVEYHEQRLKIAKDCKDRSAERRAATNLGNAYLFLLRFDSAVTMFKRTLQLCKQLGDKALERQACNNLGNAYTLLQDYKNALRYQKRCLVMAEESLDHVGECWTCWSLGNTHFCLGNRKLAAYFADRYTTLRRSLGSSTTLIDNNAYISDLLGSDDIPLSHCASLCVEKMCQDFQRQSGVPMNKPHPTPSCHEAFEYRGSSSETEHFLDMVERLQASRMDEQRAAMSLAINKDDTIAIESCQTQDENFLERLMLLKSSRLEDQRCLLPSATHSTSGREMHGMLDIEDTAMTMKKSPQVSFQRFKHEKLHKSHGTNQPSGAMGSIKNHSHMIQAKLPFTAIKPPHQKEQITSSNRLILKRSATQNSDPSQQVKSVQENLQSPYLYVNSINFPAIFFPHTMLCAEEPEDEEVDDSERLHDLQERDKICPPHLRFFQPAGTHKPSVCDTDDNKEVETGSGLGRKTRAVTHSTNFFLWNRSSKHKSPSTAKLVCTNQTFQRAKSCTASNQLKQADSTRSTRCSRNNESCKKPGAPRTSDVHSFQKYPKRSARQSATRAKTKSLPAPA